MDTKTKGIVVTIAAVVLCGCPGLFMCLFGATSVFASLVPGADINVGGSTNPASATAMGAGALCLSIIFIAIPIAVGFFMLRKKPETATNNEPIPPAS